jgi:ATP-dependent exoDNAse (exonuclease V) beta subunit
MERLSDQKARNRFVTELDRIFSVLAPAGVGKTRAIVDRVVNIATSDAGRDALSRLVVVTYTNKAADEMQQRARTALLAHKNGATLMGDFNRAFFGTIHSFCLNILRLQGHYLGLPSNLEMANDRDEDLLWVEFFRQFALSDIETGLTPDQFKTCFRHLRVQEVVELARYVTPGPQAGRLPACPAPDFESVLAFQPDGRNRKSVDQAKEHLRLWKKNYESDIAFLPLPEFGKGGAEFQETWRQAFAPLREWLSACSSAVAVAVAADYQRFRIRSGRLTYTDQIAFALELLKHPEAGPKLRSQGYRIILDEAQDTDQNQFRVLLELARPPTAEGFWIERDDAPPGPGRFCMVGDPQQSIYGKRADLAFYQTVRESLEKAGAEELEFHVTFRCAKKIITTANTLCPSMLNGKEGQVAYVELKPKPAATRGQVVRFQVSGDRGQLSVTGVASKTQQPTTNIQHPTPNAQPRTQNPESCFAPSPSLRASQDKPGTDDRLSVGEMARIEAQQIASWIKKQGFHKLGARAWSEVAILCARKRWIDPVELALKEQGLPVQNHSLRTIQIDDPAFAWFTALMVCVAEPKNGFEIVGALREVFGLSDQMLYDFAQTQSPFQIETRTEKAGTVADTLNLLHDARQQALRLPIVDAARHIVDITKLCRRLAVISSDGGAASTVFLDSLLAKAAEAEADGLSFPDWTELLRQACEDPLEAPPTREEAIQLITCHAAKGLEWDAVIIPFMCRPIMTSPNNYPYVYEDKRSRKSTMVFGKDWLDEDDSDRIKRGIVQENQRLLYVAMTRARNTLVLMDDESLFGWKKDTFVACLGISADKVPPAWRNMDSSLSPPTDMPPESSSLNNEKQVLRPPITAKTLASAVAHASAFPARILPYSLARHILDAEPEHDRNRDPEWESEAGETAKRYGIWWHGLMEKLDWKKKPSWNSLFEAERHHCPIPERAAREWPLFLKSDIAGTLASPTVLVQVEVPFLRPREDGQCVEGFIDLVACDEAHQKWIVLDWKTNLIEESRLGELWQIYEPQIKEYVDAIRLAAGPKATIASCLYSTCCGKIVEE